MDEGRFADEEDLDPKHHQHNNQVAAERGRWVEVVLTNRLKKCLLITN